MFYLCYDTYLNIGTLLKFKDMEMDKIRSWGIIYVVT